MPMQQVKSVLHCARSTFCTKAKKLMDSEPDSIWLLADMTVSENTSPTTENMSVTSTREDEVIMPPSTSLKDKPLELDPNDSPVSPVTSPVDSPVEDFTCSFEVTYSLTFKGRNFVDSY